MCQCSCFKYVLYVDYTQEDWRLKINALVFQVQDKGTRDSKPMIYVISARDISPQHQILLVTTGKKATKDCLDGC